MQGVSLTVARGERLALLGKSGPGKSTLLNLLGGLDQLTSGKMNVAGEDVTRMNARQLAQSRLKPVGMIFQSYNLITSQTALQNVELPLMVVGSSPRDRRTAASDMLQKIGLAERLQHRPTDLSGGEQQRVAIARALMNQPDILLADESTGNLDSRTAAEIAELLQSDAEQRGTTIVLITHDHELDERFSSRVVQMKDGLLVEEEDAVIQ